MRQRLDVAVGEALRWYLTRAKHPFKTYIVGHFWWWFEQCGVWIRYDGDGTIHVQVGEYVQQRIFFDGYYERPLVEWLDRTVQPGDVLWDVGANVGALTLVAARRGARVVAFEPDGRSRAWLERNVAANGLTNVTVVPMALGARSGQATLHQAHPGNLGRTSLVDGHVDGVSTDSVEVMRADDFVAGRPNDAPTLIKIDVEGAEHLVLQGAAALLRSARVRAVVFEDRQDDRGQASNALAVQCLTQAGFDVTPFGASDPYAADGMVNFLATPRRGPAPA